MRVDGIPALVVDLGAYQRVKKVDKLWAVPLPPGENTKQLVKGNETAQDQTWKARIKVIMPPLKN